jgi:hypothetical protein
LETRLLGWCRERQHANTLGCSPGITGLGTTYNNIGLIYSNKGDWDTALMFYQKDEKIKIEVGDKEGLAYTSFINVSKYLFICSLNVKKLLYKC